MTPHPVIVAIRANKDDIKALLYPYSTAITGWGVLLRYNLGPSNRKLYVTVAANWACIEVLLGLCMVEA